MSAPNRETKESLVKTLLLKVGSLIKKNQNTSGQIQISRQLKCSQCLQKYSIIVGKYLAVPDSFLATIIGDFGVPDLFSRHMNKNQLVTPETQLFFPRDRHLLADDTRTALLFMMDFFVSHQILLFLHLFWGIVGLRKFCSLQFRIRS